MLNMVQCMEILWQCLRDWLPNPEVKIIREPLYHTHMRITLAIADRVDLYTLVLPDKS